MNPTLKTVFEKYCTMTSIHGFQYIKLETNMKKKLFWIFLTSFMTIGSLILVTENTIDFMNSRTRTYVYSTTEPIHKLYFPSVFICNINQVTRTALRKMNLDFKNPQDVETIEHLFWKYVHGDSYHKNSTRNHHDHVESVMSKLGWKPDGNVSFLQVASQKPNDSLLYVRYKGKIQANQMWGNYSITDFGACSWLCPEDFEKQNTSQLQNGIANGFKIVADTEIFDYAYFPHGSSGFMIAMANYRDKVVINQRVNIFLTDEKETK